MTTNVSAAAGRARVISDPRPVASYARISKRKAGDGAGNTLGMVRQHADNRDYCAGVFPDTEVVTYGDNMSGWDEAVTRPGWEALLTAIRAGEVRAVVAWHADRFTRQPLQLEHLAAACKQSGTELHTSRGGHVTDLTMLRIQAALAAAESDQKSARTKRKHREIAAAGRPHGGRRRWGYEPGMTEVRETEAAVIREVAARLLRGETLYRVAQDLTVREVPTANGGAWTGPNLRTMILRPHLAGVRVHNGEHHPAAWPAILTPETAARLSVLLGDASRKTSPSNARVYLLAGLARCTCGEVLRGRPANRRALPSYACATGRHVHRRVDLVDAEVEAAVLTRLERMDAAGLLVPDEVTEDLDRLRAEAEALALKWDETAADLDLSAKAAAARTTAIEARQDQVAAAIRDLTANVARPAEVLRGVAGPNAAAVWAGLGLDRKRAVIATLCTVTLSGGPRWSPLDVDVDFGSVVADPIPG